MNNSRKSLLKKIMEIDFAITDFHLYLDTHPSDAIIASKLEDYRAKCKMLKKEYEIKYGPISSTSKDAYGSAWTKNPWPWDFTWGNKDPEENTTSEGGNN